jgi:hypothetical protein
MRFQSVMSSVVVVAFVVLSAVSGAAQEKAASRLDGKWTGKVDTDIGSMAIDVTLSVSNGKAAGSIATAHGEFIIKDGTFANGKWTLPFTADGVSGRLVATLKGDELTGDWINPSMATGTFALVRAK